MSSGSGTAQAPEEAQAGSCGESPSRWSGSVTGTCSDEEEEEEHVKTVKTGNGSEGHLRNGDGTANGNRNENGNGNGNGRGKLGVRDSALKNPLPGTA